MSYVLPRSGAAIGFSASVPRAGSYRVMYVAEALGGGVGHIVRELFMSHADQVGGLVVHGSRDFDETLVRGADHVMFVTWDVGRELRVRDDFRALTDLMRLMRAERPTLVYCHSSKAGALGRVAARLLGIPCLYTPHSFAFLRTDVSQLKRTIYKAIERSLARTATTVACGLEEFELAKQLGPDVQIIENGVDLSIFSPAQRAHAPASLRFLSVGRRVPQKDFPFFEKMAAHPSLREHRFVWVTGEDIEDQRPTPNLRVLGRRTQNQVADLMRTADCYVSTSRWEGLARSVLEAAASGLPLLLRDAPGNREMVFRNLRAQSFSDLDAAVERALFIASAVRRDPQYGLKNRKLAETYYDNSHAMARMRSLYDAIAFRGKA